MYIYNISGLVDNKTLIDTHRFRAFHTVFISPEPLFELFNKIDSQCQLLNVPSLQYSKLYSHKSYLCVFQTNESHKFHYKKLHSSNNKLYIYCVDTYYLNKKSKSCRWSTELSINAYHSVYNNFLDSTCHLYFSFNTFLVQTIFCLSSELQQYVYKYEIFFFSQAKIKQIVTNVTL